MIWTELRHPAAGPQRFHLKLYASVSNRRADWFSSQLAEQRREAGVADAVAVPV
jgi:hypothetical protein